MRHSRITDRKPLSGGRRKTDRLTAPKCGGTQTYYPDGTVRYIDPGCAACWEMDETDLVGKNWMSFLDSKCDGTNAQDLMRFLNTRKESVLCSRWFKHPIQGPSLHRSLLTPILDDNRDVIEIVAIDELIPPPAK